jgi:TatD DNase family protein
LISFEFLYCGERFLLVDSHCHLDRLDFDEANGGIHGVVNKAMDCGVSHFLCVSVHLNQFPHMMEAIKPFDNVFASCGVHPLNQEEVFEYDQLLSLADNDDVVAVGETGLDYFYAKETQEIQKTSFAQHIKAANQLDKPLIIHTRGAQDDTLAIMREHNADKAGGVFHCFTEEWDMAKQGIEMGFYISISGIVTFRNASALREVVKKVPLDRLLVETDSPYLAPVPHRGQQNQPAFVREVAEFVADLKDISLEALAEQTTENFFTLFSRAQR